MEEYERIRIHRNTLKFEGRFSEVSENHKDIRVTNRKGRPVMILDERD